MISVDIISREPNSRVLNEMDLSSFHCKKLVENFQPTLEQDIVDLKDHFWRLKFNYIELFTKQRFLESLIQPRDEWKLEDPVDLQTFKSRYKEAKSKKEELVQQIQSLVDELVAAYEKFRESKEKYSIRLKEVRELLLSQRNELEPDGDSSENNLTCKRVREDKNGTSITSPLRLSIHDVNQVTKEDEWYDLMSSLISKMHGVEIVTIEEDCLVVRFFRTHELSFRFVSGTTIISSVQLVPNDIPINDIVERADGTISQELKWIVNEIKSRIWIFQKRLQEIESLKQQFTINYDTQFGLVNVEFLPSSNDESERKTVLIRLERDYPQEWTGARVISIGGAVSDQAQSHLKKLNSESKVSLTKILSYLKETIFLGAASIENLDIKE